MRYVITPTVAVAMARDRVSLSEGVELLAPTLFRSEVLALLFHLVRTGDLSEGEARTHLDAIRGQRMRLLGDRVLQRVAWDMATELGWDDTLAAEYLALTRLQADALVTEDAALADAATTLGLTVVEPASLS